MAYYMKTIRAGRTVEVRKYFAARMGTHCRNGPRREPTSIEIERSNIRKAENNLRWLLNENFRDEVDALCTLSWKKGEAPADSAEMKRKVTNFLRRLKDRYRKAGKELRYVYTMEVGPRGSRHIHIVLSDADLRELRQAWGEGPINIVPLWSDGQYGKIAAYFVKYSEVTERTEGRKVGRRYCPSLNLRKPKIKTERISRTSFREPRERKGWVIDQDYTRYGINELDGRPFSEVLYVRADRTPGKRRD